MIIIGGGSAGLFLSEKYAEKNDATDKVILIEEHTKPGLPVQCTGIITDEINKLISQKITDKFTLNKIKNVKIYSPNNCAELKIKENIIIDNKKFIELLAEQAEKKDVKILTSHRYISNSGSSIKIKDINTGKIKSYIDKALIGTDGPQSKVASCNRLNGKKEHLLGIQARIKIKDLDKNMIDFYPYIGEYAWSVPENDEISRIGIAIPLKNQAPRKMFEDFLKKYPGKRIETQGGLIPIHKPGAKICRLQKNFSVALAGDSAGQIKNTTGGGIIPGLKAAEELSKGIETYPSNIRKLDRELYIHYIINRALRHYTGKDWDRLVSKVKDDKVKSALEKTNRDNAAKLILSLAKRPSMVSEGIIALTKIR